MFDLLGLGLPIFLYINSLFFSLLFIFFSFAQHILVEMSKLVEYLNDVIGQNYSQYPCSTILVIGLSIIGFTHFTLLVLSYGNMLADLFIKPATNVRTFFHYKTLMY